MPHSCTYRSALSASTRAAWCERVVLHDTAYFKLLKPHADFAAVRALPVPSRLVRFEYPTPRVPPTPSTPEYSKHRQRAARELRHTADVQIRDQLVAHASLT